MAQFSLFLREFVGAGHPDQAEELLGIVKRCGGDGSGIKALKLMREVLPVFQLAQDVGLDQPDVVLREALLARGVCDAAIGALNDGEEEHLQHLIGCFRAHRAFFSFMVRMLGDFGPRRAEA